MVHFLGCGRASIYTWLKMGREAPEMLAARPHLGPEPGLDDARLAELERLLLQGAKRHGFRRHDGLAMGSW